MNDNNNQSERAGNPNYVIQEETAAEIWDDILDWYDIEEKDYIDGEKLDRAYSTARKKIIRGICKGYVEVLKEENKLGDEVMLIKQNFKNKYHKLASSVTYSEVNGRAKKAIRSGQDGDFTMMYKFLGSLCAEGEQNIEKLRGIDNGICESLGYLFLQV